MILFISESELFLLILFILESFSIVIQSLTLSNRLSINIFAGTLLISLLSSLIIIASSSGISIYSIIVLVLVIIIYSFEILNSLVQILIFSILSNEYLLVSQIIVLVL